MTDKLPAYLQPDFLKRLERLRLVAKRLSRSGFHGEHPSSKKGLSIEFSDYRTYQRGDDLRYVDWNVYRRLDRLFVKIFTAEEEMNVYLFLDASGSMAEGKPPKIEYAKSIAAALGYIGLKNLDKVGGMAFSSRAASQISPLMLGRGSQQILGLFRFLESLGCHGETKLEAAVKNFSLLFPRPGLVVFLSDLFDPEGWRAGLEELVKKRHQLVVVQILDDAEMRPAGWGDLSLTDVENGRERKVFLDADLAQSFDRELKNYLDEIQSFCSTRQIDYLRATTATPFEQFVLDALRRVRSVRL